MPPVPPTLPLCSHLPQRQRWHQEEGQCRPIRSRRVPEARISEAREEAGGTVLRPGGPRLEAGHRPHSQRLSDLPVPASPSAPHAVPRPHWVPPAMGQLYNCAGQIPTPDTWHGAGLAGLHSDGTSGLSAALKPEPLHRETQQKTPLHTPALLHSCFGSSPFILKARPSVLIAAG